MRNGDELMMDILQNMMEKCLLFFALFFMAILFWKNWVLRNEIQKYKKWTEALCFERDYDGSRTAMLFGEASRKWKKITLKQECSSVISMG
jgi:hypothetical protein